MLIEETGIAQGALPVNLFRDHLRLGTGFADDGVQDSLAESYLRAALAAIELRIGKALLTRRFRLSLPRWRDAAGQALPLAPVTHVESVTLIDALGQREIVAPERYRLMPDRHRPRLLAVGLLLPMVPTDGEVEIAFDAGFGLSWQSLPADLAQAVLLLAAQFYENRHEGGASATGLPPVVQGLVGKWRNVRVLGGGEA